jgi:hypothetical protein
MHSQGIPSEDQGLHQRKLVCGKVRVIQITAWKYLKKIKHLHINWLLELWSLRNVARWFQILLSMSIWYSRYWSHRPVMIRILPNISSILVDVWIIGYLKNWFDDVVIGFWIVGLLIFVISWVVGLLIFVIGFWVVGLNVVIFIEFIVEIFAGQY